MDPTLHPFVPDEVMGGMTDTDKMFLHLIRNATKIWINVDDKDIAGAPFEADYLRLKAQRESESPKRPGGMKTWVKVWHALCEIVFSQCHALIEQIAPPGPEFRTLNDYWETPYYVLRLKMKDGVAAPEIERGPERKPVYFLGAQPTASFSIPDDIPVVPATELEIVRKDGEPLPIRTMVTKIRDAKGNSYFFHPGCAVVEANKKFSQDLDLRIKLHQTGLEEEIAMSKLAGVVVANEGTNTIGYLTPLLKGSLLANLVDKNDIESHGKWKQQVLGYVEILHAYHIMVGTMSPWKTLIDDNKNTVIVSFAGAHNPDTTEEEDAAASKNAELEGVKLMFDKWLPSGKPWSPNTAWKDDLIGEKDTE